MTGTSLQGKKILVVEDTVENMRLFRAILSLEGAEVLEADRAQEGIEVAKDGQPDLILMDLQMPDMDGLTAIRILRESPEAQAIPIMVVTAFAMEQERRNSFEAGCDAFVTKPVDPASLVEEIAALLDRKSSAGGPGIFDNG